MSKLSSLNISIQRHLFPALEAEIGELSEKEQKFVRIVELVEFRKFLAHRGWCGVGRKPHSSVALAKAFIAKSVWNLTTNRSLIDLLLSSASLRRLCGWDRTADVPAECSFSRFFADFAQMELPQKVHEHLVREHLGEKLCGHISRDATAIHAREKPEAAQKKSEDDKPKEKKKRGRPKKEEQREKEPRRLELQPDRSLEENLADLPKSCNVGCKKNSKGYKQTWIGYKLHLDVVDGDIPISAILTSASLHDTQVAIPLAQMSDDRVTNLYDLMDAGYDAKEIHEFSQRLGHVPIIDNNPGRGKEKKQMSPAEKERFKERSAAERVNSNLKDNYGGNHIRVRGAAKVACHLMFGLLALTATQLYNLLL